MMCEIKPLTRPWPEDLIAVYKNVWSSSPAYGEAFESKEVENAINKLDDFWIASCDGKTAGFVGGTLLSKDQDQSLIALVRSAEIDPEKSYFISQLGIEPQHRQRGLGGDLLCRIVKHAKDVECTVAILQTTTNPLNNALALYERNGFYPLLDQQRRHVVRNVRQRRVDLRDPTDTRALMVKRLST